VQGIIIPPSHNAVIYSLDLETYMDLNGDGIGDFEGLTSRLDYLHALGVDTVWLAPFQISPNKDNGYDIKDYYSVDPRHGSLGNFVEFMHQAHKRGIKVIVDLVVNHTSIEHRWFQEARSSADSPYRNWYHWSEEEPENADEGMVFPGVQERTWTYDKKAKAYYHHRFFEFQPDLNFDNPNVREEVRRIMGFWLELGIAGFRIDAGCDFLDHLCHDSRNRRFNRLYFEDRRVLEIWRYEGRNLPDVPFEGVLTVVYYAAVVALILGTVLGLWYLLDETGFRSSSRQTSPEQHAASHE